MAIGKRAVSSDQQRIFAPIVTEYAIGECHFFTVAGKERLFTYHTTINEVKRTVTDADRNLCTHMAHRCNTFSVNIADVRIIPSCLGKIK